MRVAILGAGAIGGFLASALAESGLIVTVLARGPHLDAIKSSGLRLRDASGQEIVTRPAATDDPAALGRQDLLITTLKAPALASVLATLPAELRQGVPVIMAMNGVFWWYGQDFRAGGRPVDTQRLDPGGRLAAMLDPAQALGAVIYSTNQVIEPGLVLNRSPKNRYVLGGPTPIPGLEDLAARLSGPRVLFEPAADIRRQMWHKLLRNLSSAPVSVLTGARVRDINDDPGTAAIARALFLEGAAVAQSHGFAGLADEVDSVVAPGQGALQQPSMRQDLNLARPLEIETMLAIVQDFGRGAGVATPVLDTVVPMIRLADRIARATVAAP
ncbi:MAG: ketopantoate reductase family protein [Pseudorhodobacter sp.]